MMRKSLLIVVLADESEVFNLRALLDNALPSLAGLQLLIVSVGVPENKLKSRLSMFSSLINDKKLAKIHICPISVPLSEMFDKARRHRVILNTRDFSSYLDFFVKDALLKAFNDAPTIYASEAHKFRKVNLNDVAELEL